MTRIGFIGLGTMGSAMAARLVAAGHEVLVWNRSPHAAEPLVAAGAIAATSAEEAMSTGLVFSMLSNDAAVDAIFSAACLSTTPGALHVNMASVSPAMARTLASRHAAAGVGYVAAPVLGRPTVAAAGKLNILAGGSPENIERLAPYLDVLGVRTWHISELPERANLVKIAVNFNLIHAIEALGESIALVENSGVDPELFVELLTGTFFGGVAYGVYGEIITQRRYEPAGFSLALGLKDLGLAQDAAAEAGVTLPTMPALRSVFERSLAEAGGTNLDWSAIAEISRTVARDA
jgi:3-hydroxyisobutyrate dehydrogenase-like beta-hydroxyacid dehydrogenase